MKRSLYVASCVLLSSVFLSSCQKEDKSVVELAHELTNELQQVTDLASANAHAPRVEVLNKRFQDASVRVLALNKTALCRGADDSEHEGESYAAALKALAKEIGRVRASYPVTTYDGEVDKERLLQAIGEANGGDTVERRREIGLSFVHDETGAHEIPGTFAEYYGSTRLQDALAYQANVATTSNVKFDSSEDVPEIPALVEVPSAAPAADDDDAAPAAADDDVAPAAVTTPTVDDTPAPVTPGASSSDDDDDDDDDEDEDDDE